MSRVSVWQVAAEEPTKLQAAAIELEKHLENWIEKNPSLLQEGLTIVGRQVRLEGGPLDLLAVDSQARWVVIELKRGTLYRDAITQALDYASSIATMPSELLSQKVTEYLDRRRQAVLPSLRESVDDQRAVSIIVVGTGRDPGLERIVGYLASTYQVPITVVSYEVFELASGQRVLVRELTETEVNPPAPPSMPQRTVEDVCALADRNGIGEGFRAILAAAQRHNLYPRPWKKSVMYAPPSKRTRALFTVWAEPDGKGLMPVGVWPQAFAEFCPVTEEQVVSTLGPDEWQYLDSPGASAFAARLDNLFKDVELSAAQRE